MELDIIYVAQGRIYFKQTGSPARPLESKFGQSLIDRTNQIQQRNAWKTEGTGARFMSGRTLWAGQENKEQEEYPVVVNAVSRGMRPGDVLFSLATQEIGGIFSVNCHSEDEQRLLHTADFRIRQLSANPSADKIACVIRSNTGSHLAVMRGDGGGMSDVTQGDSVDGAPFWVPNSTNELIFQSAGVARSAAGNPVGTSPSQIMKLNIEAASTHVLLGDDEHDYFDPKMDATGNLYCICKPYVSPRTSFNPFRAIFDLVLLPIRLLFALFQFVNLFTMRYTGKTLITSGNVRQREMDLRQIMISDNLLHARQAGDIFSSGKEWKAGRSWTLIKRTAEGEVKILEKGVLTFDLCNDGTVVFTDGNRIVSRTSDGNKQELAKDQFILQVLAVPVQ